MNEYFNLSNFLNRLIIFKSGNYGLMKREEIFNLSDYHIETDNVLDKCLNVLDGDDEWKYLFGIGEDMGRNIIFGVNILILLYILITSSVFLKNINQFMISIRGPSFCIMISIGCFIMVLNAAFRRYLFLTAPCIILTFSFTLGISLMSIGMVGYNYNVIQHYNKYMDYINNSILDFIYVEKKENIAVLKIYKLYQHMIDHVYRTIVIIILGLLAYTAIIASIKCNDQYKLYEKGFCFNKYELIPFFAMFAVFHFVFSGLVIYRHCIIQHSKTISVIFRIIALSCCITGFFIFILVPNVYCRTYYITSDSFIILYAIIIHYTTITKKVYYCYYSQNKKKKLKPTLNGLLELLSDKHLANEFTEFCRSDYCIENMMFFKEFWRYKHNCRLYYKIRSINNTDETLNDEKQIQSRNSYFDSQNITYKNPKFLSIKKLFKSMEYTADPKKPEANNSFQTIPKEIQPYIAVNMPKDICSMDSASVADNTSIRRYEMSERSKRGESDNEESSQKVRKRDVDSMKEDGESIRNSPNNDDKSSKYNPFITASSCDSNLSEASTSVKPTISKCESSCTDMKSIMRPLRRIEEDNNATTSNPDHCIDEIERPPKTHLSTICNNSSLDNRYESESLMKKRLLENINYNTNFKSDRTLSRNDKHISSVTDVKIGNNSVLLNNVRAMDEQSVMTSVNSMVNYKTMININQIESIDNPSGSMDGIIKTNTLKRESQSYSSRMDVSDTEKMLDSAKFKNVGHEKNLYDKKEANIKLHNYAQEIYDKYICPGSVYELNISNKTVKKITEVMSNTRRDQLYSEDIFNQAYIEVLRNLYLTSFQKFLKYGKEEDIHSIKRESGSKIEEDGNFKDFDFN